MRSRLRLAGVAGAVALLLLNAIVPTVERPDLVVHEEGRLAGLIRGERIATTEERPAGFIFEQWQRALPAGRHVKPIEVASSRPPLPRRRLTLAEKTAEQAAFEADMKDPPSGRFRCRDERWCVARAWNGSRIVVMHNRDLVGAACDRADLVITAARSGWDECRSGAKLLSATQLRRSGTVEIWFDPENNREFRILSGLGDGDRPWYAHRTYDWRSGQFVLTEGHPKD